jgi:PAS domain S-box-containing protein
MPLSNKPLNVLVIEDNPGDFFLINESLREKAPGATLCHAGDFEAAKKHLRNDHTFDIILLDLTLPDKSNNELVSGVIKLAGQAPVIVISGLPEKEPGMKTLYMGVSDYLVKDEINACRLFKSISYAIERKRIYSELEASEEKYKRFFYRSPLPMWVYSVEDLRFLDVNEAAIRHYGYSRKEFLSLTIKDIRPPEDVPALVEAVVKKTIPKFFNQQYARHYKKDGKLMYADIQSNEIKFKDKVARLVLSTDITDKVVAERLLKGSEQRFKALVQDGSDLIGILDEEGNYKYVSPTANLLGYPAGHFIGKNVGEFIHADDVTKVMENVKNLTPGARIQIPSFRFRYADGSWHWIETIATNMSNVPAVNGIVVNSRDITEWMEIEHRIKESNERYRSVAKATSDAIWDYDIATNKLFIVGEGYKTLFGHEIVDQYAEVDFFDKHIHPEDRDKVYAGFYAVRQDPSIKQSALEYRFLNVDGKYVHVLNRFSVFFENGEPVRLLGAVQDITERKKLDHEITKAIINAQEQERSQIGLELHDNVNQILVGALLALGMAREAPYEQSPVWIAKARSYITEAIAETRKLSHQLAPSSFEKVCLKEVFETLLSNMNVNNKMQIDLDFKNFEREEVSGELQLNLYRILQEQMNNIIKYSDATAVEVAVSNTNRSLRMRISDNGNGFDKSTVKNGIGFRNIKKRAELFFGAFILHSAVGKGCEVMINIPLGPALHHLP